MSEKHVVKPLRATCPDCGTLLESHRQMRLHRGGFTCNAKSLERAQRRELNKQISDSQLTYNSDEGLNDCC